ncbi:hypothetical protein [Aurantimonas coralicida]|uniref:hypothetical protein n=1 Tax=Aurantimonas coralicida TaxID=182270 RepID=UPI0023949C7B|nr:hypothetical protein [Aurantimonas coralicida]MDE0922521.1 hypothetical protein [Aurantimonas coralicida]
MNTLIAQVRLSAWQAQLDAVRRSGSRIVLAKIREDMERAEAVLRDAEIRERRAAA